MGIEINITAAIEPQSIVDSCNTDASGGDWRELLAAMADCIDFEYQESEALQLCYNSLQDILAKLHAHADNIGFMISPSPHQKHLPRSR